MWFEFGGSIANAVAGWFFLKQLGLVAIDVGYIPTASVTGAALAYLAYKIINKISEPFSAELIELTGEQVDDTTGEMPFLLSSQEQVTIATQDTVSAVGYSQL